MHLKVTDKQVSKNIFVSIQARRNYLEQSKELASMVKDAMPFFRNLLDLPKNIYVRIGTKRGSFRGSYNNSEKVLFLNVCKYDYDDCLTTLAHELVHAEQYKQGRLSVSSFITKKGYINYWNGEEITNKGRTYNSYRKQPWEVEAFGRQSGLAKKVKKLIEEKYAEDR